MRNKLSRRTVVVILAAIFLFAWISQISVAQDRGEIRVRSIDKSRFPKVGLTVFLSGAKPVGTDLMARDVDITENDKSREVLQVDKIGSKPMTVVLVIDTSGSMSGEPLNNAKSAAKGFIQSMKPAHQLAIVSFNTTPAIVVNPTSDRNILNSAVDSLTASTGDTALYDALTASLDVCAKTGQMQNNVIVLSDGADNKSTQTPDNVIKRAKELGVAIFGVGLISTDFNQAALDKITSDSGGRLVTTPDPQTLSALYQSLAAELSQQYLITYISGSSAADRNLNIKITARIGSETAVGEETITNPSFKPQPDTSKSLLPAGVSLAGFDKLAAYSWWYPSVLAILFFAVIMFAGVVLSMIIKPINPLKPVLSQYDQAARKTSRPGGVSTKRARRPRFKPEDERQLLKSAINMTKSLAEKRGLIETIQIMLMRAGIPLKPAEFIFFHFLAVLIIGLISLALFRNLLIAVVLVVAAAFLPLFYAYRLINKRKKAFQDQLSDLLLMMAGSLKAGHGLLQALRVASEEMSPPASLELKKVLAETNLGLPIEEALDSMVLRIGSEDLTWTVTAIKIHLQIGDKLASLLETLAATVRERDMVTRQVKSLTAEGRVSAIILFALPFLIAAFMFIVNRSYVSLLFQTTAGLIMVAISVLMMITGAIWLKKIVTIEV